MKTISHSLMNNSNNVNINYSDTVFNQGSYDDFPSNFVQNPMIKQKSNDDAKSNANAKLISGQNANAKSKAVSNVNANANANAKYMCFIP